MTSCKFERKGLIIHITDINNSHDSLGLSRGCWIAIYSRALLTLLLESQLQEILRRFGL